MTILEEALKVERNELEEQEINLRKKLISAWEQSRYVEKQLDNLQTRLLLVCDLLGKIKTKEVA